MQSQAGRIVVGYDGSEAAGTAVDWAAEQARRRRCPLAVVHALDHFEATPGPLGVAWLDLGEDPVSRVAAEGVARARKHADNIEITSITEPGPAAKILLDAAHGADLVVVGTRGHSTPAETLLGSVSVAVSTHARCPTIVVRGDSGLLPGPHRPVVVGVDDSPGADAALQFAAETAASTGAPLIVVSGYQPALMQVWTGVITRTLDSRPDPGYDDGRSSAEKVTATAARIARTAYPGLKVTEEVRQGPAAGVIAGITYHAGLAVVGSRGRGGFSGLLLGSVSHRLLHAAMCPVAVVRGIL